MRLELNGILITQHPDEAAIAQALGQMKRNDVLTLRRPPADFVQVIGAPAKGFTLNVYEDAQGASLSSKNRALRSNTVARALAAYLHGDPNWKAGLAWQSGVEEQRRVPGAAGLIAFAIFGAGFAVAIGVSQMSDTGVRPSGGDWLRGFAGVAALSLYIGWLDFFFAALRPRLADQVGARLGARVAESLDAWDAGTWNASGGRLGRRLLVYGLDFFVLIVGVMAPVAAPAALAFILFAR